MRLSVTAAAVGVEVLMASAVRRPLDLPVPLRWTGIDPASRVPIQRQDLGVASPRQLHNQRCRQRARQGDLLSPGRRGPCSHDLLHRLAGQRPGRCGCLQHRVHPRGVGLTQPAGPGDNPGYVRTRSATAESRARPSGGRGHWRWSRSSARHTEPPSTPAPTTVPVPFLGLSELCPARTDGRMVLDIPGSYRPAFTLPSVNARQGQPGLGLP